MPCLPVCQQRGKLEELTGCRPTLGEPKCRDATWRLWLCLEVLRDGWTRELAASACVVIGPSVVLHEPRGRCGVSISRVPPWLPSAALTAHRQLPASPFSLVVPIAHDPATTPFYHHLAEQIFYLILTMSGR